MEFWDLYWISRLDGLKGLFALFGGGSVIMTLVSLFLFAPLNDIFQGDDNLKKYNKGLRCIVIAFVFSALIFIPLKVLTPTSKEVLAFYAVDVITHEEKVIDTADKLYQVVDKILDEQLKETK